MGPGISAVERGIDTGVTASTPISEEAKLSRPSDLQDIRRALANGISEDEVAQRLSAHLDPAAKQALQQLLASDKLSPDALKNLSDFSSALGKGALPSGLTAEQGKEFLNAFIKEAANPNELNQGRHAFCAVLSPMWNLARTNTSEFLRIGLGIANEGEVKLAGGQEIEINLSALKESALVKKDDAKFETLSLSERVVMAALTDFANGGQSYDFTKDKTIQQYSGKTSVEYSGLYADEYLKLVSQLNGKPFKLDSSEAAIRSALTVPGGVGTMVDLKWNSKGDHVNHMVTFVGFDDQGNVLIRNPWGQQKSDVRDQDGPVTRRLRPELGKGMESISADEFFGMKDGKFARINGVVIPGVMTEQVIRDVPTTEPVQGAPLFASTKIESKLDTKLEDIRASYQALIASQRPIESRIASSTLTAGTKVVDERKSDEEAHMSNRRSTLLRRREDDGVELG